jgi:hypothetical protein
MSCAQAGSTLQIIAQVKRNAADTIFFTFINNFFSEEKIKNHVKIQTKSVTLHRQSCEFDYKLKKKFGAIYINT